MTEELAYQVVKEVPEAEALPKLVDLELGLGQ
jgi:hypothetical protein